MSDRTTDLRHRSTDLRHRSTDLRRRSVTKPQKYAKNEVFEFSVKNQYKYVKRKILFLCINKAVFICKK